jgi:hypothetical protein
MAFAQAYIGGLVSYGMECSGFESRWGQDFPCSSRPASRPTQPLVSGLFLWGKAAQAWLWTFNPFWCRGYVWVELYLYLRSVPSRHVIG